jgi:hypothetical protein
MLRHGPHSNDAAGFATFKLSRLAIRATEGELTKKMDKIPGPHSVAKNVYQMRFLLAECVWEVNEKSWT